MTLRRDKTLMIGGGVASLMAVALLLFLSLFDINHYRQRIETALTGATGLTVRINGKMGLSLLPFGVSARDIHLAHKGSDVLSLESLKLGVDPISLVKGHLAVTRCDLVKPVFTIVKDATGRYNFAGAGGRPAKGGEKTPVTLHELRLSRGSLVYLDRVTGEKTEAKELNLALREFSTATAAANGAMGGASFSGSLDCGEVAGTGFRAEGVKAALKGAGGKYDVYPLAVGTLVLTGSKGDEATVLSGISLAVRDLTVGGAGGDPIRNLSFSGEMTCRSLRKRVFRIDDIKAPIEAANGVIRLAPLVMEIFGARGEGDATADRSGAVAVYNLNLKVPRLDFARLEESFGTKRVIGGKGDLQASLTLRGGGRDPLANLSGVLSLRGAGLVIHTMDLDKVLSTIGTTQEFNLADVGSFFVAGPLGPVALRGYYYGDLSNQFRGGQGSITRFVANWKIRDGVADATDCALATRHNRVALKGRLNLVTRQYDNVTVALLDGNGCVTFSQSIGGSFGKPEIGMMSKAASLAGPLITLFRKAQRLVRGGTCEVFYRGSVPHPR